MARQHKTSTQVRKPNAPCFKRLPTAVACTLLAAGLNAAWAAPISLAQVPAGNGGREPAPNLIISVDDSGSMGSSGMTALRNALTTSFSPTAVPDDSIRLGFQAMWRCRGFGPGATSNYGGTCPENRVKPFSGTHRTGFNNWVNSLQASSMTPSHLMVKNAGEFMKTTGIWNPYAHNPGTTETPLLACRKSFHIFMTDGEWNSESSYGNNPGTAGNADGLTRTLPDGTVYDPYGTTDTQTRVYRDTHGAGTVNTLADFVFDYWSTDLQPGIANQVRPIIKQAGPIDVGPTGSPYVIQEYWNPRNNPATWQSLTTYTIGFGSGAALSTTTAPRWGGTTGTTWSGGDYIGLLTGTVGWGNPISSSDAKRKELWHMALSGRGRYVSANNATELSNAFAEIINQVIADSSAPMASIAANTQAITAGTTVYVAGYDAAKWSGHVRAYALQSNYNLSGTPTWDAAQVLDSTAPNSRLIFTHDGSAGTSFDWSNLSTAQQDLIKGSDAATVGQDRLAYIRGDRTKEQAASGPLRDRNSRLGDIVNSNMWVLGKPNIGYTGNNYASFRSNTASRPTMIYIGGNDGMLHAFNASTGAEQFAYIPQGVYSKLKAYTDPAYTHQYTVDGHPFTGDIHDGSNWKTMLVGSLAGGGKGYFVLDVTNPGSLTGASGSSLVVLDKTDGSDPDIGHIYGEPTLDNTNAERVVQITKLNNNRWAVLMGNGINSTSEKAMLLIQYLDGARELVKIELDGTGGNGNGLSNPQVIDINGDGKADLVYAGDHQGNLWKVNLSSTTPSNWGSYYSSSGTPLPMFVARDESNARQPISTAPQWATHPVRGLMVAVGTGREMTVTDRLTTSTQSLYAIWDDSTIAPNGSPMVTGGTAITNGRSSLVAQTQSSTVTIGGRQYFKTSANPVPYTGTGAKRGWYMDWPTSGERSVNNGGMLTNKLLFMRSRIPANGSQDSSNTESCEPTATSAREYLTVLDIVTGQPPSKPMFDTDGGGFTGTEETGVSRWHSGRSDRLMIKTGKPGEWMSLSGRLGGPSGSDPPCTGNDCNIRFGPPIPVTEFGWRQLQ